jgi:hypothetical protein
MKSGLDEPIISMEGTTQSEQRFGDKSLETDNRSTQYESCSL